MVSCRVQFLDVLFSQFSWGTFVPILDLLFQSYQLRIKRLVSFLLGNSCDGLLFKYLFFRSFTKHTCSACQGIMKPFTQEEQILLDKILPIYQEQCRKGTECYSRRTNYSHSWTNWFEFPKIVLYHGMPLGSCGSANTGSITFSQSNMMLLLKTLQVDKHLKCYININTHGSNRSQIISLSKLVIWMKGNK